MAQWIAHQTSNLRVVGSSPTVGISSGFPSLVKGERLKIACICFVGSNPTPDTCRLSSKVASGRQTFVFLTDGRGRTPAFLAGDGGSNPLGDALST